MTKSTEPKKIKTTETVFEIIEQLSSTKGANLTELTDKLDLSKSTIHTHLVTLCDLGYVIKEKNEYQLGPKFLTPGGIVQRYGKFGQLYKVVKPAVDSLAQNTQECAQFMVESHSQGFFLYQAQGNNAVQTDSHIGMSVPLHATAVGKAYLAHISEERVQQIMENYEFTKETSDTIADTNELSAALERVRDRGFAFDRGERIHGIRCVAAPVQLDMGRTVGSVSVSLPAHRAENEYFEEELPPHVLDIARTIGLNATYS